MASAEDVSAAGQNGARGAVGPIEVDDDAPASQGTTLQVVGSQGCELLVVTFARACGFVCTGSCCRCYQSMSCLQDLQLTQVLVPPLRRCQRRMHRLLCCRRKASPTGFAR